MQNHHYTNLTDIRVFKNPKKLFLSRKKRQIIGLLLLFFSFSLSANEIKVKTITFHVDSSFTVKNSNNLSFFAEKTNAIIALASPDIKDFSPKRLFESMDTISFNLKEAKLVKSKSENFLQWTRDCFTKYYNNPDGSKLITHTFYTNGVAYCLYASYHSDDDEKLINETINSIWLNPQQPFLYKVFSTYNYSSFFWIAFAILTSLIGLFLKESEKGLFFSIFSYSLIAGVFLLFTTEKHWEILGCALLVNNIILVIAYYLGIYITFDVD